MQFAFGAVLSVKALIPPSGILGKGFWGRDSGITASFNWFSMNPDNIAPPSIGFTTPLISHHHL